MYRKMNLQVAVVVLWAARLTWVGLALAPNALGSSLEDHGRVAQITFTVVAWALWSLGTFSVFWLSPISLTAIRIISPLLFVGVVVSIFADPKIGDVWPLFGCAIAAISVAMVYQPSFAAMHVQASAYGDEIRLPLRIPVPQVLPVTLAWLVMSTLFSGVVFSIASRAWLVAPPLGVIALFVARMLLPQLHRFSRRWLVVVPAGVVVHDQLLLAETFMVRTSSVTGIRLANNSGEALNLSGMTRGNVLVVTLRDSENLALSPYLSKLLGTMDAVHVKSYAIAPTLAGQALTALTKPPATT